MVRLQKSIDENQREKGRLRLLGRLGRLRDRLLHGQVLPFVGAGISQNAWLRDDPDFRPQIDSMRHRLEAKLREALDACEIEHIRETLLKLIYDPDARGCKLGDEPAQDPDPNQTPATEESQNRDWAISGDRHLTTCVPRGLTFDRLAEVGMWLCGHERVCEAIEIDKFARLEPLPAHRYLAYLAREGLITEIISTNYDCCLERAFRRSFGRDGRAAAKEALAVVLNLNDYRESGGRRFTKGPNKRPILHLYKINGCAEEYRTYREAAKVIQHTGPHFLSKVADRIILTESQLQSFRSEEWARELFRDRSRTRALLLCGFGSEEPQVRHTALQLAKEFGGAEPSKRESPDEVAGLPNAPFVAAFERVSFAQLQVLRAFASAHLSDACGGTRVLDAALMNAFSGEDERWLSGSGREKNELSADLFLGALYLLGFRCQFEEATENGSPFLKWLGQYDVPAGIWREYLRAKVYANDGHGKIEDIVGVVSSLRELLTVSEDGQEVPLRLWEWIACMERPTSPPAEHDWYLPLAEDSLLVLSTLLFLFCLTADEAGGTDQVKPEIGLGLRVKVKREAESESEIGEVHLVSERGASRPASSQGGRPRRLIRRISLPSLRYPDGERRLLETRGGTDQVKRVLVGRIITVAAGDLIKTARRPEGMSSVLGKTFAAHRARPRPLLRKLVRKRTYDGKGQSGDT